MSALLRKELRQLRVPVGLWLLLFLVLALVTRIDPTVNLGLFTCTMGILTAAYSWQLERRSLRFLLTRPVGLGEVATAKFVAIYLYLVPIAALYLLHVAWTAPRDLRIGSLAAAAAILACAFVWHDLRRTTLAAQRRDGPLDRFISLVVLLVIVASLPGLLLALAKLVPVARFAPLLEPRLHWTLALAGVVLAYAAAVAPSRPATFAPAAPPDPFREILRRELRRNRTALLLLFLMGLLLHGLLVLDGRGAAGSAVSVFGLVAVGALILPLAPFHAHETERTYPFLLTRPLPRRRLLAAFAAASLLPLLLLAAVDAVYVALFAANSGGLVPALAGLPWLAGALLFLSTFSLWLACAHFAWRHARLDRYNRALAVATLPLLLLPFAGRLVSDAPGWTPARLGLLLALYGLAWAAGIGRILARAD